MSFPPTIGRLVALTILGLLAGRPADAGVQFVDVAGSRGIGSFTMAPGMGGGIAAADYDDDGDIDLFVPNAAGVADQLYRNRGDGNFDEIAGTAGLASTARSRVALWLDHDGDHLLDLLVAGDCFGQEGTGCSDNDTLKLYRQIDPLRFEDVTATSGLVGHLTSSDGFHRGGLAAGDINGDGFLEVVMGLWSGEARLFVNDGDGTFTDISLPSGVGAVTDSQWQPILHDFDGDGRLDIYWAIDYTDNHLWLNNGDETFTDVALGLGVNNAWNDMGVALGDHDNSGTLDLYITNIGTNVLYRNDTTAGTLAFTETAAVAGVPGAGWAWGTTFFDADRDGLLDLAVTNGFMSGSWPPDPSRLFLNAGGSPVTFVDASASAGFDDTFWGSGLAALDHDRDGDLDLVQATQADGVTGCFVRLLDNQPSGAELNNSYLVVRPRMSGANHRAIGALVYATVGATEMVRPITAGISFHSQEPAEAFFGLGAATEVDSVRVQWPDGTPSTEVIDVAVNQVLDISVDTDTDGDGLADAGDDDDDGDGILDAGDCFPTSARIWQVPGQVEGLTLAHAGNAGGITTLSWPAPATPGGVAPAYDTLFSASATDFTAAACVETHDGTDNVSTHDQDPQGGTVLFALVVARNACGIGPAGMSTVGTARAVPDCLGN